MAICCMYCYHWDNNHNCDRFPWYIKHVQYVSHLFKGACCIFSLIHMTVFIGTVLHSAIFTPTCANAVLML